MHLVQFFIKYENLLILPSILQPPTGQIIPISTLPNMMLVHGTIKYVLGHISQRRAATLASGPELLV